MQRCDIGYGAASPKIHVRHVHRHCTVLYLVRKRHLLGCPPEAMQPPSHIGDDDFAFTQACIMEKLEIISVQHG